MPLVESNTFIQSWGMCSKRQHFDQLPASFGLLRDYTRKTGSVVSLLRLLLILFVLGPTR